MNLRNITVIILGIIFSISPLFSQSGMRFPQFSKKLEYYFGKELIADVAKELPQGTNYTIWGWDVGDFSGDGNYDVAFVVKSASERKKIVHVYIFADVDGFLTLIDKFPYKYVEMPLEVGIIIRSNTCYITQKHKQYNWSIIGYRFVNGNLVLFDDYTTKKHGKYTYETYRNFQNLVCTEKIIWTNKRKDMFFAKYLSIPCYPRGKHIYKGYTEDADVYDVDFVTKGAWYWSGIDDASYRVKAKYDKDNLYLAFNIRDDIFIPQFCEDCIGDHITVWFDFSDAGTQTSRFPVIKKNKIVRNANEKDEIYSITIFPGDFMDKRSYVSAISSTNDLKDYQRQAVDRIKSVAVLKDSGYSIKVKIPFTLFGYESAPVSNNKQIKILFTSVFHDIDNEFRPEEETNIATSIFHPSRKETYSELMLIPKDEWYGEAKNHYKDDLLRFLMELGF